MEGQFGYFSEFTVKEDVGNAILDTKGKIVLAQHSMHQTNRCQITAEALYAIHEAIIVT